ncbi:GNAT family N-acetyltransferase [Halomonas urumqiensis]|uniref:GNAT family N-acetyltransferase n=1 Tax=Halomonas urumqiensis TaxID=1684789 RepID=A0A2N7UQR4_9GAMM|nr:GNAT family N-acetyltransferase [Halomonas urumqiensis]PMR82776.1 GNAT family N-acetyltransferase [Halomonas urumqiensis]PTB01905.1 N-acetyltransferase [Halomonas urumqiensis]GHE22012.1 N-acetyltransferase GCN5 [Halomonas urumqiensis]
MEERIRIVRMTGDSPHVATLAAWTHDAWGHLHPGRDVETAIELLRGECGPAGVPSVFAALAGNTPVGTASLVSDDMSDRLDLTPWLASVFVLPAWRGRGIASRLVQRVEEEARTQGHGHFYLYTPDQQPLYRRLGWRDLEERVYRGEAVTIMCREFAIPNTPAG